MSDRSVFTQSCLKLQLERCLKTRETEEVSAGNISSAVFKNMTNNIES